MRGKLRNFVIKDNCSSLYLHNTPRMRQNKVLFTLQPAMRLRGDVEV